MSGAPISKSKSLLLTTKVTRAAYLKQWKLENKDKVTAYQREYSANWYRKNPERYLLYQAKSRAKKLGLPFDLTLDDVQIPVVCPILGIELVKNYRGPGPSHNSPSLDRIQPELGYVKGNIQVISNRANLMKNDASLEELRKFADWVNQLIPS